MTNVTSDRPAKPRCRWFRFSLRALLVASTALALCLGWFARQFQIVNTRKAFLREYALGYGDMDVEPYDHDQVPLYRMWLGDECVMRIDLKRGADVEEVQEAKRLFPEAIWIMPVPPSGWRPGSGPPAAETKQP
jgi:hypothetical protein